MPLSALIVGLTRPTRVDRNGRWLPRSFAWAAAAGFLVVWFFPGTHAVAQLASDSNLAYDTSPLSTTGPTHTASDTATALDGINEGLEQQTVTDSSDLASLTPFSTDQIIAILQQNPDLSVELKSQLADRAQQQGMQVDPGEISDQMLYRQIATNASLRAGVSDVLRTRGFTSDSFPSDADAAPPPGTVLSGNSSAEGMSQAPISGAQVLSSQPPSQSTIMLREDAGLPERPLRTEKANASTDLPRVQRVRAPYELESLHDLYTQLPSDIAPLKRFGSDVFIRRSTAPLQRGVSAREAPLDVPLGPDYIVGAGDTLTIELWGGITQRITRMVDRKGSIFLPEAGPLQAAGLSLAKAQELIAGALRRQYRNAQVAVSISGLRSVRVYVVGDVQRPGGYDVSVLATPLSVLYVAGGPTAVGSLRTALHYRGKQIVEKVDLYDFLLHGIRNGTASFQSGDTLVVPPAGPQVAVLGAVRRPAIYEVDDDETSLATLIEDAGGFTAAASLGHIRIERIDANHRRETVSVDTGDVPDKARQAVAAFRVQDGDRIYVEPILPYSQRTIYLAGHVVRPGRLPYTDGMRLTSVLRSYRDMLPEPADCGEIIRLVAPDLHPEAIDFSVPSVLNGNTDVDLHPFDTIRILGRYQVDAPMVTIRGGVLRPGNYPMPKGMTASQLVRIAGGFRRDALRERADLTSYEIENGNRVVEALSTVRIGDAVSGTDPQADVPLKPGDVLSIHQITSWNDIGESVTIRGQVRFPGSYGFKDGERLSSVLSRAGGFLPAAYPAGAVLERTQVRDLEQKSHDELVRQIETNSAAARLSPSVAGSNTAGALQLIKAQQEQVLEELKTHSPSGRMVIHISPDIKGWANTPADIELRRDDVLTVPKRPGFVLVTGQVYNATALTFAPGKTAEWYLSRAGGTNSTANRKEIVIIRANGSVVGRRSHGWLGGDVLSTRLDPGDVVIVPQKIIGGSLFWRNLLSAGQLAASVAITAGVAAAAL